MLKTLVFPLIAFLLMYSISESTVIINEIQPAPIGDEPEWLELFNPGTDTLELIDFTISDNVSTKEMPDITIPPKSYVLISKDTFAIKQSRDIPETAMFCQMTLPIFNNTYDMAVIADNNGNTADSLYYDLNWGTKGITFERIDHEKPAFRDNISPSVDPSGATAGKVNSVVPVEYDLEIISVVNIEHSFVFNIKNIGKYAINDADLYLFISKYDNSISDIPSLIIDIPNISSGDSTALLITEEKITNIYLDKGFINISALIHSNKDENSDNDSIAAEYYLPYPPNSVLINEFLYQPEDNNAEFIEFYNISKDTIDIKGWMINDQYNSTGADEIIIKEKMPIPPDSLFVIAMDSTIFLSFPELNGNPLVYINNYKFNLNNDTDEIIISQPDSSVQDSLRYYSSWHSEWVQFPQNISLEKKYNNDNSNLPQNWASSTATKGSTPLSINSTELPKPNSIKISAKPNPFSRIVENNTKINLELPFDQQLIKAYIFTPDGILVRKLADDKTVPSFTELIWNGINDDGYNLQIGPYVLLVEAADMASNKIVSEKIMLVIGE